MEKTRKVTRAMEAVSAAKMRKAQAAAQAARAYARAASSILKRLSGSLDLKRHALMEVRGVKRALFIVITSDKGLAGGLNANVLRAALSSAEEMRLGVENTEILAVGRKARDFFTRRNFAVNAFIENSAEEATPEVMQEIVERAAFRFSLGEVDTVRIAYPRFISTFEQAPTLRTIFPLSSGELEQVVRDITPLRGRYANSHADEAEPSSYEIEPSPDEVLSATLPRLAGIFVYHALLEAQACEHSARMVSMKNASDKGAERVHMLTLQFNKARQAAITREVSEIIGGMEAIATDA